MVEQINNDLRKSRLPEIKLVSFFEKANSRGAQKAYDDMVSTINDYMPKDGDEPGLLLIWHARHIKSKRKDTKNNIHAFPLVLANHKGKKICVFGSITTPELVLACQAICNGSDDVTFYMPNHGVQNALLTCDTLAMMILSRFAISNDIDGFIASLPVMNDTVTTPEIMDKIAKARDDVAKYAKAEVLSIAPIVQENFKKNRIIGYSMPNFLKVCCQNVTTLDSIPNGSVVSMPEQEVQTKEDFMEKYFNNETKVNNYTSIWSLKTASKYIPGYDKLSVRYYYRPKISDATIVNPNIPKEKVKQYKHEKEKVTSQMTDLSIIGKVMPTSGFSMQRQGSVSNNTESISQEERQHTVTNSALVAADHQYNPYVSDDDAVEYDVSDYKSNVVGNGDIMTVDEEDEPMMPHLVKEEYKYETDIADHQYNPYVSDDDTVEYDIPDYKAEVAEKDEQIINSKILDLSRIVDANGNRVSHKDLVFLERTRCQPVSGVLEKTDRNSLEIIESIINNYKPRLPIRHHPIVHKVVSFIKANQVAIFNQKERWGALFRVILEHHSVNDKRAVNFIGTYVHRLAPYVSEVLDLSRIIDANGNRVSYKELIIPQKKGKTTWKGLLEKTDRNSLEIIESIINDYKLHAPMRYEPIVHKIVGFIKANQSALLDQKKGWNTLFHIILAHHNVNKGSDRNALNVIKTSLKQAGLGMVSLDFRGLVGFAKRQLDESLKIDIPRSLKISPSDKDAVYSSNRIAFDVLTEAIKSYPGISDDVGMDQKVSSFDARILQFVKNNRETMLSNQDGWIKALMLLGAKNDNKNTTVSDKNALCNRLKSIMQREKKVIVVPDSGTDTIDLSKIVDVKGNKISYKAFTFPNWRHIHGNDVKPVAWLKLVDKNVLDGLIEIVKEYPDDTKNTQYPAMVRRFESFIQRNRSVFSNQDSYEKEKWRMLFLVLLQHCGLGTHHVNQLICGKLRIKKPESLEISFNGLVRFDGSNVDQGLSVNTIMQAKEGCEAIYDKNQIAFTALKEAIDSYPVVRTGYNAARVDLDIKIAAFTEHNKNIMSQNAEHWSTILRILSVIDEGRGAKIRSKRSLNETIRSILKATKDKLIEFDLSKLVDCKGKSGLESNIIEVPLGVIGYENPQLSFMYNKHRNQFDVLRQIVDSFAPLGDESTRIRNFIATNMEYLLGLGDASRTTLHTLISKCYPKIYENKLELQKTMSRFQSHYNAVINGESYEQYRMRYRASAALKYGMDIYEYAVAERKRTLQRKGFRVYELELARKKAHDIFEQYGVDWLFVKSKESPMSRLPNDVVSADVTTEDLEDLAEQLLIMTGMPSQISANNLKNNIIKQWKEAIMLRAEHVNKRPQKIESMSQSVVAIAHGASAGSANADRSVWPAKNDSDSSHDSLDWAVSMPKKACLSTINDKPLLQARISSSKEMLTRVRMKLARYKYHGEADGENITVNPSASNVKQRAFWHDKEITRVNSSKNSIDEYSELDEMSLSDRLMLKKEHTGLSKQASDDCNSLDNMSLSRRLRLKRKANFSSFRL